MAKELNYDDIAQFMSSATGKKDAKPKPDEAEALAKLKILQDSLERAEKGEEPVKDEDYEKRKQDRQKKREEEGKPRKDDDDAAKDDDDDEDEDPHGIMDKLMALATPKNLQVLEKMGILKKLGPLGGLLKMLVKSNSKGGSGGGGGMPGLNTGMLKNLGGLGGMLGGGGGGDSGGSGGGGGFNPALLAGLATQLGGPDLGAMGGGKGGIGGFFKSLFKKK